MATCAGNALLALKISYINSLVALCARVGADIDAVTRCMGAGCPLDRGIGSRGVRRRAGSRGNQLMPDFVARVVVGVRIHVMIPIGRDGLCARVFTDSR